jgi:hypothetical protein
MPCPAGSFIRIPEIFIVQERPPSWELESSCQETASAHETEQQDPGERMTKPKPRQDQLDEIKQLSAEARVPDMSEMVTSIDHADRVIADLKEKKKIE